MLLTSVVGSVGAAVVGRLGDHVGKVDALAEHVAGDGGLRRRDPQTLFIGLECLSNKLREKFRQTNFFSKH